MFRDINYGNDENMKDASKKKLNIISVPDKDMKWF